MASVVNPPSDKRQATRDKRLMPYDSYYIEVIGMSETVRKEFMEWGKAILWAVVIALLIRSFLLDAIIVDGISMHPFLENRERVFVNRLVYRFSSPRGNDIIVFERDPKPLIKRVIAVAGQTIEVTDGQVIVDGIALTEPYLTVVTQGRFGPYTVPEGTVFVMGDNRNVSLDSRDSSVGPVSLRNIRGKALAVYWPLSNLRMVR